MRDTYARSIDYLRIAVTDRCNFRCVYCMPEAGVPFRPHAEILRYEEIERIVRVAAGLGIRRVRLTGGEPLVRMDLVRLVHALATLPGIEEVTMTTNGTLLAQYAQALAEAGLKRVNVSLDTLQPERFRAITRRGELDTVLAGIDAALQAGLTPLKVNMVVMRGQNDDEIVAMAEQTLTRPWHVRFIEWMPIGPVAQQQGWKTHLVTAAEMRARLEAVYGPLIPVQVTGAGPARTFRLENAPGTIGFISAVSEHFCATCNRLRLTADGKLRFCLLREGELDLRSVLRAGCSDAQLTELIAAAILAKPAGHQLAQGVAVEDRAMAQIGG